MRLAPSIIAADFADLAGGLAVCERGGAELVHFDVMDGHFVPNLTVGAPVLAALHRRTHLPLDVHLMVGNPDRLLDDYLAAGAARIAVHWEATACSSTSAAAGRAPASRSIQRRRSSCSPTPCRGSTTCS